MKHTLFFRSVSKQVAIACLMVVSLVATATGQEKSAEKTIEAALNQAARKMDKNIESLTNKYRDKFRQNCKEEKLKQLAAEIISIESKFQQLYSSLQNTNERDRQIRTSIRKFLRINDKEMAEEMLKTFRRFHDETVKETFALVNEHYTGPRKTLNYKTYSLDDNCWSGFLETPLMERLKTFGNQDWARFIAITAGSSIASELMVDSARDLGLFGAERGSMEDQLVKFLADLATEALLDELTDPSGDFAKKVLKPHVDAIEKAMFSSSETGFAGALQTVGDYHKKYRRQFLLPKKEKQK